MNYLNKKVLSWLAISAVSLGVFLLTPATTFAKSGPVGLNNLMVEAGPGTGEVTLNWQRYNSDVTNYGIMYGTKPGVYTFGADRIGNIVTYTIKGLTPGVRYYFKVYPYRNDQNSPSVSPEISEVALAFPRTVLGTAGPFGRNDLTAIAGPNKGQVTISWKRLYPDTDSYTLVYGLKPGVYIYGVVNAKDASNPNDLDFTYTIGDLASGVRYYFAIIPQAQGNARYLSAEVSQLAK